MPNEAPLLLVAEDDNQHGKMLESVLREWGFRILKACDGAEAIKKCREAKPDLALLDMRMPVKTGAEALSEIKKIQPDLPVIIMTAYSEVQDAVAAMRAGAYDYLTKPLDFNRLKSVLRGALSQGGEQRPNDSFAIKKVRLTGESPAMVELLKLIEAVAPTEATVLIGGESGTGKELAARTIHAASHRASGPFVPVNCGALTEGLLASELFGHEKGAFTGADRKHKGLFMEACGGTLFLDEIGEMPLGMQVKLLRVLQEKEVLSVGGTKPEPVDCRIIAATNRDLEEEVAEGRFRKDLFYRLNVVHAEMPPLRERKEDIPALAENFAAGFAAVNRKRLAGITGEAMALLQAWPWPGNARELENVMERAVILMTGEYITPRDLPANLARARDTNPAPEQTFKNPQTLEEVERNLIEETLKRCSYNKTEAARLLGITRKTLYAKLARYQQDDTGE